MDTKKEHDWSDGDTGREGVRLGDDGGLRFWCDFGGEERIPVVSDSLSGWGEEMLRLAGRVEELEKERDGYKELLSDELLRGAAEIREMARKSEAADRQLVAHLGAIVGLESATVLQAGDQPPFAMAICGELLMAAWKLREETERLRAAVDRAVEVINRRTADLEFIEATEEVLAALTEARSGRAAG